MMMAALSISCGEKRDSAKVSVVEYAKVEKVAMHQIDHYYEAVGIVRSKTTTVLSAKIVGSVIAVRVREGETVRSGETLIEIDNREASAQLQKAQAGLREAENALEEVERSARAAQSAKAAAEANRELAAATFNRYKILIERRSVTPQEFDEVQARYKVADAEVERAEGLIQVLAARRKQIEARIAQARADVESVRIATGYSRIVSPISGIIILRQVEPGFMAAPGAPLLTIEDNANYRLEASVEESRIASIRPSDKVTTQIDALGHEDIVGRVVEIVPVADPASRSYTVKIELAADQSKQLLRSGLYGKARFASGQREAITIPQKAIIERGQLIAVYTLDANDIAHLRLIKTGKSYGDRIEILSGINEGERVVVEPVKEVSEGSRIDSVETLANKVSPSGDK
jgi:multidrug efflux pump subunit AcrA (membrane-fusion protein)